MPSMVNWLLEPLIYLLLLIALVRKPKRFILPFLLPFLLLFIGGLLSIVVNHQIGLGPILSNRLLFRYYIFFLALSNLDLTELQMKKLNSLFVFWFLIQIPVATIKFFIYGQGERAIGTYSVTSGSISTMIPLIAIGYLFAAYLYYKRSWVYFFLAIGFVYFAVIGGKRAFCFMLPVLLLFLLVLCFQYSRDLIAHMRKPIILFSLMLVVITGFVSLKFLDSLNPERSIGGSIDISYAINYVFRYTTSKNIENPDYSAGRFATTKHVFTKLFDKGLVRFFFGYGPGSYTKSRFSSENMSTVSTEIPIQYGLTPMTYIAIEYGLIGVLAYIAFLLQALSASIRRWKLEIVPYWKAFSFGSVAFCFSMLILFSYYNLGSVLGDTIPCVYFYSIAFIAIRFYKHSDPTTAMPVLVSSTTFKRSTYTEI